METTKYWVYVEGADGSEITVLSSNMECMELLLNEQRDYFVEKVTEEDVTKEIEFLINIRKASGDQWQDN
jgi:hypothetical protein